MNKVFQYLDYRKFLKDRFAELKSTRRNITHRYLCSKAGFASPNFLKLVMEGQRNLTSESLCKVCRAFELNEKECTFFKALVEFNQAKDFSIKDEAYIRLKTIRNDLNTQHVDHAQMEYLQHWYHVAIRELVELPSFQEDLSWIQNKLEHKIKSSEIKKSLQLLEQLGFIKRNEEGRLVSTSQSLSTGNEVSHLAAYKFHQEMLDQAKQALTQSAAQERDISSITVAISHNKFKQIKNRIQEFRKELLALAAQTNDADTVYQLNLQFFNLTENVWTSEN